MIAKAIDAIVNLATRSESPKPIEVGGRKGIYLPDGVIEWDMQKKSNASHVLVSPVSR